MPYFARDPTSCSHRCPIKTDDVSLVADATCGVLREVGETVRAEATRQAQVSVVVCEQCCRWPEPSVEMLNPVIASMVLDRFVDGHNEDAPTPTTKVSSMAIESLRQRAIAAIPIMSDEPDAFVPSRTPPPDIATVEEIERHLPLPTLSGQPSLINPIQQGKKRWMIGVTTSPRLQPTLEACLASISIAGWSDVCVFHDGKDDRKSNDADDRTAAKHRVKHGLNVTRLERSSNVGAWSNFVLSALEMVHRDPDADAYMMLQDDALLTRSSAIRPYLERLLGSIGPGAAASLFSCQADTHLASGWRLLTEPVIRGAEGFVMTREAMWRFLDSPMTRPWQIPWHHGNRRPLEQRGVDGNVGRWACESGTPLWLPSPSLIWHIGDTSTLWPGAVMLGIRRAGQFLEQALAESDGQSEHP